MLAVRLNNRSFNCSLCLCFKQQWCQHDSRCTLGPFDCLLLLCKIDAMLPSHRMDLGLSNTLTDMLSAGVLSFSAARRVQKRYRCQNLVYDKISGKWRTAINVHCVTAAEPNKLVKLQVRVSKTYENYKDALRMKDAVLMAMSDGHVKKQYLSGLSLLSNPKGQQHTQAASFLLGQTVVTMQSSMYCFSRMAGNSSLMHLSHAASLPSQPRQCHLSSHLC